MGPLRSGPRGQCGDHPTPATRVQYNDSPLPEAIFLGQPVVLIPGKNGIMPDRVGDLLGSVSERLAVSGGRNSWVNLRHNRSGSFLFDSV